ncbi:acyl-CoA thioesterase [Nonomuraea sp. NPDC049480]|uniref:acyl-CoA thioesterase n=1 Tax=Nonomuraea sp. NPDC049480 TaxID=3364353 RepID=UPI00379AAB47
MRRQIEHVDTDASGVVHFSRHVSLMETAALDLLDEHGAGLMALAEHGVGLAVTEMRARYHRPCGYRDTVFGEPVVEHAGGAAFRTRVTLFRLEPDGLRIDLSTGHLVFAAVDLGSGRARPLPPAARHTLKGLIAHADLHPETREPDARGIVPAAQDAGLLRAQTVAAAPAPDDLPRPDPRP